MLSGTQPKSDGFSRIASLLAVGWVTGVLLVWLVRYEVWVAPVQFLQLALVNLGNLRVGPFIAAFLGGRLLDLLSVAGMAAAALGVGALVVKPRGLLEGLCALAFGFWIVAVTVLVVGAFSVKLVPVVFVGVAGWFGARPREWFCRGKTRAPLTGWEKTLIAFLVVAAGMNLLGAMAPPFEYDELEYHLGALAEYQKAGRIVFLPHNFYSNLPQLTEMLYLLGLQTGGEGAAKLMHWLFGVLAAAGTFAVAGKHWNRTTALTAAVLFYCVPFIQDLSQTARIDLATAFFAVLAFGLLDNFWLSAALAGMAVATKWTAVPVVVLPVFVWWAAQTKSFRRPALFALLSSLFVLPWLVKNWLLAGNPVYPLFDAWFGSPFWSASQAELFSVKHYGQFDAAGWGQIVTLMERFSFKETGAVPVLLMVTPLILLVRDRDGAARRMMWLLLAGWVGWWALTYRPWRFVVPVLPLAAMLGAYAVERLGKRVVVRGALVAALCGGLCFMGGSTLVDVEEPTQVPSQLSLLDYAMGEVSRNEFVSRVGRGMFEPVMWMNRNLPANAKVLYVGEAQTFYARGAVLWSTAYDQHPLEMMAPRGTGKKSLLRRLKAAGVTHVYINFSEWERLRNNYGHLLGVQLSALRKVLQNHARRVHVYRRNVVWELTD